MYWDNWFQGKCIFALENEGSRWLLSTLKQWNCFQCYNMFSLRFSLVCHCHFPVLVLRHVWWLWTWFYHVSVCPVDGAQWEKTWELQGGWRGMYFLYGYFHKWHTTTDGNRTLNAWSESQRRFHWDIELIESPSNSLGHTAQGSPPVWFFRVSAMLSLLQHHTYLYIFFMNGEH